MAVKFANNAYSTLAASISDSATSITLTTGEGARFPSLTGADYFYATLIDSSNNLEIVKVTARATDVLTVTRAQESTTARAYTSGDRIELRVTAAGLDAIAADSSIAGDGLDLTGDTLSLDLKASGGLKITATELELDTATALSWSEDQTFEAITETVTAKSAGFTPDLSNDGTVYNVTGAVAVTMPTAEAGKSFTIIASAPVSSWTGTIKWASATVPSGTGIVIYSFVSDGTNWYGFEAGNAFG